MSAPKPRSAAARPATGSGYGDDPFDERPFDEASGAEAGAAAAALASSGRWAALARTPDELMVLRLEQGGAVTVLRTAQVSVGIASLSISQDERWLAAGCHNGEVLLWAVDLADRPPGDETGSWPVVSRVAAPEPSSSAQPPQVAFSPTEPTLAVAWGRRLQLLRLDAQALQVAADAAAGSAADGRPAMQAASSDSVLLAVRRDGKDLRFVVAMDKARHDTVTRGYQPSAEQVRAELSLDQPLNRLTDLFRRTATQRLLPSLRQALLPPDLSKAPGLTQGPPLLLDIAPDLQAYPWELLLTVGEDAPVSSRRRGLLRLPPPGSGFAAAASPLDVLMVIARADAQPLADDLAQRLSALPGARLQRLLCTAPTDARTVIDELLRQPWQALVLIGPASADGQGLALPGGAVLGAAEIAAMGRPPDLVFVADGVMPALGPALLQQGVRCCVAPAWAVADEPAQAFGSEFWRALAAGQSLLEAVTMARQYAGTRHPDDWAWVAYACHGDPAWQPRVPQAGTAATSEASASPAAASEVEPTPAEFEAEAMTELTDRLATAMPGEQVVRITPPQGPAVDISVESARELAGAASEAAAGGETGGWLSRATSGLLKVVGIDAAAPAPSLIDAARALDARVQPGLYALTSDPPPQPLHARGARPLDTLPAGDAPLLVLVHGLMSHTGASFGAWWERHPALVDALFKRYEGRLYGLEQATLGQDPLDAALALARVLPPGARLHLLTHDSGALVAELLAVAAQGGTPDPASLDDEDGRLFKRLLELQRHAEQRRLRVERIVRVAGPMRGMLFDARRADLLLAAMSWGLQAAGGAVAAPLQALLGVAARDREGLARLPGLAALQADGALLRWLNQPREPLPGELRVVAGRSEGGGLVGRLGRLLVDQLFGTDNDLVVPTASMSGGAPRQPPALYLLDSGPEVSHFNYFRNEATARAVADALLLDQPPQFGVVTPDLYPPAAR